MIRSELVQKLVDENKKASKLQDEYELLDTGIFDTNRYFDIVIEYAKEDAEDILRKLVEWDESL